ncbi:MAG: cytidine deaminase [Bryobacteraceae bacterium]|nr:cytidine deaminase [Bryobacteraceae bacterium]MDW8377706.1 cytidine deaminase [Bryobacterales bacterium]
MDHASWQDLIQAALAVRQKAQAPYSKFFVGAALEDRSGKIHTGCNVENATYGLTICAERVAVYKAISEGCRAGDFRRLAIAADSPELTPPCGACRQILWEFGGDLEILLVNLAGESRCYRLSDLLPLAFDARFLSGPAPPVSSPATPSQAS